MSLKERIQNISDPEPPVIRTFKIMFDFGEEITSESVGKTCYFKASLCNAVNRNFSELYNKKDAPLTDEALALISAIHPGLTLKEYGEDVTRDAINRVYELVTGSSAFTVLSVENGVANVECVDPDDDPYHDGFRCSASILL